MNILFRTTRVGILVFASMLVFPGENLGQVFDLGPSDSALFTSVINLPPDPDIPNFSSIGGVPSETVQLNVANGGIVGYGFDANSGAEVNISGGTVRKLDAHSGSEVNISGGTFDDRLTAHSGSVVNIGGGTFGDELYAYPGSVMNISGGMLGEGPYAASGSVVNISGGSLGRSFAARSGSDVELIGGEFNFNGASFTGGSITLASGDIFTGTLADGSVFISEGWDPNFFSGVTLTDASLPAVNTTPRTVNTDISTDPSGLRSGQELTLHAGGVLGDNFAVVDAKLNIDGGSVGDGLAMTRSIVNISGGTLGSYFYAFKGSVVNISGGTVGRYFEAFDGSEVNISGGTSERFVANSGSVVNISGGIVGLNDDFDANSGSVVNISGGTVGDNFDAFDGSEVNISGGSLGSFDAFDGSVFNISGGTLGWPREVHFGSDVELIGGEFNLNGAEFTGTTITLASGDVFSGTFADGSSFIFKGSDSWPFSGVKLTEAALPAADTAPRIVNTDISTGPSGLRSGEELTLQDGGVLGDDFAVVNAKLNIDGGNVGDSLVLARGIVDISGGTVGSSFEVFEGGVVNISGGTIGSDFDALEGSEVNISGGTIGERFYAFEGSVVNISGGTVGETFAFEGSAVNLFGSEFLLDGVPLDLSVNGPLVIADRDTVLSGILADGSAFSFHLNSKIRGGDFFSTNAMLTVSIGSPFILGDVNTDGAINFGDIPAFIAALTSGTFQSEADIDLDGAVTFADIPPFVSLLLQQ